MLIMFLFSVLGPINSTAQLQMNPKPENDGSNYSIPKILLNIVVQELAIGMSKFQVMLLFTLVYGWKINGKSL